MPLYRDDQGGLYLSPRLDLTGERVRPQPIAMPEGAWLRVAQVKPGWSGWMAKAGLVLSALSLLLVLAAGPLLLLWGRWAGMMALWGMFMVLILGSVGVMLLGCRQVAMDRPLRLVVPQPRGLMLLELLRPWGAVAMLAASLLILHETRILADIEGWLWLGWGLAAAGVGAWNLHYGRRVRQGAAPGLRRVG